MNITNEAQTIITTFVISSYIIFLHKYKTVAKNSFKLGRKF